MRKNEPLQILKGCIKTMSRNRSMYVKQPGKDFSRKGKLPFESMLTLMLSMQGKTIRHELFEYFGCALDTASSSAFVQKREKLATNTMEALFHHFAEAADSVQLYKGYRLIAVDGSDIHIPTNPQENESYYPGANGQKPYNLIHLNALYDVLQRTYIDAVIQNKTDESAALCEMVDRLSMSEPTLILADRGYESYNNLAHVIKNGWKFLFRVKDIGSYGIVRGLQLPDAEEFDFPISLQVTRKQSNSVKELLKNKNAYKFLPNDVRFDYLPLRSPDFYPITFRVVRFQLSDGNYEVILTDLDPDAFPPEELKKLYAMRWGIETSFRDIKHTLGLLYFHSKKVEFISQEIFAAMIMYNLTELITSSVVIEQDKKYVYRVNFTDAAYIVRQFFLGKIPPPDLIAILSRYVSPIRPDRKYKRGAIVRSARYFLYRIA